MRHESSAQDSPPHAPAAAANVRIRLIPALNPCWRLWMREEGPLELMCLAQLGLELWSVQTDGLGYYLCHNRMIRKVSQDCEAALRRDIHAVRGGFVKETRLQLESPVASNALFNRESSQRLAALSAAEGFRLGTRDTGSVIGVLPSSSDMARAAAVQVSYRRRRHVSSSMRPAVA